VFSSNEPLRVRSITAFIKDAAKKMGFDDVCLHEFRWLFVTTNVNAPGVSMEKSLAATCNSSVAAQRPYQVHGAIS